MVRLVNVHYLDKWAFMNGNVDEGKEPMVFDTNPSYEDVVVRVRSVLRWIDPSDEAKLVGRYDVGVGVTFRLKTMPITFELHWNMYKDKVEESQDKSLESFSTKVEVPWLQIDLNWNVSSLIHDDRVEVYYPVSSSLSASSQPDEPEMNDIALVIQHQEIPVIAQVVDDDDAIANDHAHTIAHDDTYAEEEKIHYNPIGNLDVIVYQQDMDHSLPYAGMCGYGSYDEGLEEELDEDGFTSQENQIFKKVKWTRWIHGPKPTEKLALVWTMMVA
ncbi:hypothetical protein D1007_14592 [Hordeum vulgare]|nr:hypothetical protein D1007_14592 [Hordeum vulgare]